MRKSLISFLTAVVFLSFLLRYPYAVLHNQPIGESAEDSVVYHYLAAIILERGYNPWILDPLSHFGMYPYSDPFGPIMTMVALGHLTDLDLTYLILIFNFHVTLLGLFSMLMLCRLFNNSNLFLSFGIMVYITHWYFVDHTLWSFSHRGIFFAQMPLFLWIVFSWLSGEMRSKIAFVFLSIAWFFTMYTIHGMSVYAVTTVVFPLIIISFGRRLLKDREVISTRLDGLRKGLPLVLLSVVLLSVLYANQISELGIPLRITDGSMSKYPEYGTFGSLLSIADLYLSKGIMQVFSVVGIFLLSFKAFPKANESVLLFSLPFQALFIPDLQYFLPVILPIISLLTAFGVSWVVGGINSTKSKNIIVVVLLSSLSIYSVFIKDISKDSKLGDDYPQNIEGSGLPMELENTELWANTFVDRDGRILGWGTYTVTLSYHKERDTLNYKSLIFDDEYRMTTVFERLSLFNTLFYQAHHQYGAKASPPLESRSDTTADYFQTLVETDQKAADFVLEKYNVRYIVIYEFAYEHFAKAIYYSEVEGGGYALSRNEMSTIYYYHNF